MACPAETVWTLIGDFGGLHRWHPLVRSLDLSWEGRIRTLHFDDGGHAVERLEARNDRARRYAYALVDGPFAIQDCHSTLEVRPGEDRRNCVVIWTSSFEPVGHAGAQADVVLEHLYGAGLRALESVIGMT
ncbi:hypothetical protein LF63_0101490 [Oleiagrimonas soli]|uniref:Polyketide cyclase n=1 Tax=Oleiagrimonas soli TaxID=1543381 RepID=A0A099CYM4_9GAMM|nr:hypothetical protein LF63_0101490 [Oleiagrimonas soli]